MTLVSLPLKLSANLSLQAKTFTVDANHGASHDLAPPLIHSRDDTLARKISFLPLAFTKN